MNHKKDDDEAKLESLAKRLLSTPPVPRDELSGKGKPLQPKEAKGKPTEGEQRADADKARGRTGPGVKA